MPHPMSRLPRHQKPRKLPKDLPRPRWTAEMPRPLPIPEDSGIWTVVWEWGHGHVPPEGGDEYFKILNKTKMFLIKVDVPNSIYDLKQTHFI